MNYSAETPTIAADVTVAVHAEARVGEGPFWEAARSTLHWVDILEGELHSTDTTLGSTDTVRVPTLLGAAARKASGGFVLATAEGFAELDAGGNYTARVHLLPADQRMNDAKCDLAGRFWAGSTRMDFSPGEGALHVLEADWSVRTVLEGLTLPNGLGWSPDARTFYLADSEEGELLAFDFDLERGELSGRRQIATFDPADGVPDGLTIDSFGCIWIAMWGGSAVLKLSPEGERIGRLPVPAHQPSSCGFGGAGGQTLFITSAREGLTLDPGALDGSVFQAHVGAEGTPTANFAG